MLGATRNLAKRTVLPIVNLQFSEFLQFGNLAIWSHSVNGASTQIGHLLFFETKIGDFWALRRFGKVGPLRFYQRIAVILTSWLIICCFPYRRRTSFSWAKNSYLELLFKSPLFLNFRLFYATVGIQTSRWDSNRRPLVSEVTTTPLIYFKWKKLLKPKS